MMSKSTVSKYYASGGYVACRSCIARSRSVLYVERWDQQAYASKRSVQAKERPPKYPAICACVGHSEATELCASASVQPVGNPQYVACGVFYIN